MFTYQIIIEYDGKNFVGWQKQKNGSSIQQSVEKILTKILKEKITLYGSGRTDAGVHAMAQSAHFILKSKIDNRLLFLNSINFFLNKKKISILSISKKKKDFHARHSATKRTYKYIIANRTAPLSLDINKAWHVRSTLNITQMEKGAKLLQGTKDFSTYRSSSCGAKSAVRTIKKVMIKKENNKVVIVFISKSFLQQQVRSMVGCLKFLGEGKWSLKKFKHSMNSKKRFNCAPPAPAHGLYLLKVNY